MILPASEASLRQAADLLLAGQLCAFPTETVYGLGADARNEAAVRRIYTLKGRPATNPLIVHVADLAGALAVAAAFPDLAHTLAARFWPGPLTLVVPRGANIPALVSAGLDTVAVRVPAHPVAQRLLALAGLPIAAPSANRSESVSPTQAEHVARGLPQVPLIIDGGACRLGIESTVVDVSREPAVLLRPGALPLFELRQVVPGIRLPSIEETAGGTASRGPGMMARHYAPQAPLYLSRDLEIDPALLPGPVGWLVYHREARFDPSVFGASIVELLPADPAGYGADLYAALHRLDAAGARTIVAEMPPDGEAWLAVRDRLRRAAVNAT